MNSPQKNVLIVDDEKPFLLSVTDGLRSYAPHLKVYTSVNGKDALKVLKSTPIDIVATDLKMPEMDGFELLAYMTENYPYIPIIVITAFGTLEIEERLHKLGSLKYLEKPIDLEVLGRMIIEHMEAFEQGKIQGITLPGFLQLIEMEKKTCALRITSGGHVGFLFIQEGRLIAAQSPRSEGEHAAYEITAWDDASIEIGKLRDTTKKTMDFPLGHMIMEAFRIKDEKSMPAGSAEDLDIPESLLEDSCPQELRDGTNKRIDDNEKEKQMSSLKEKLKGLTELDGVSAVCLVGRDGFLIDSISETNMDTELIGAISSGGFGSSESIGREIGKGSIEMVMLEYENGPVMFSPVGEDAFLVIVAQKSANLGLIRVKIKKHGMAIVAAGVL